MFNKLIFMLLVTSIFSFSGEKVNFCPESNFVPDEETAIKIAEAVWIPIYGGEKIKNEKPIHAKLVGDSFWEVYGSLPKGCKGGVAEAKISKSDGRIIYVCHGK